MNNRLLAIKIGYDLAVVYILDWAAEKITRFMVRHGRRLPAQVNVRALNWCTHRQLKRKAATDGVTRKPLSALTEMQVQAELYSIVEDMKKATTKAEMRKLTRHALLRYGQWMRNHDMSEAVDNLTDCLRTDNFEKGHKGRILK